MSEKTAENKSVSNNLPQFMRETNEGLTNSVVIDEKNSWLNNNLHKLMVGVSALWFAIVLIYITQFFGWSNLFLMMPDEFGGFLAGVTLPLAIIWVVMAYIDRGSSFKQEAKFLRAYMNQLVYPEDGAPQTAKAMADAIRSQVVELQQASKQAQEQTSQIRDGIKNNIHEFSKLIATLDNYSAKTIVELSESVKFLMNNFENIINKAQSSNQTFTLINQDFIAGSMAIEKSLNALLEKISPHLQEFNQMVENLNKNGSEISTGLAKADQNMKHVIENTSATFEKMQEVIGSQIESLQKLTDTTSSSCFEAKNKISKEITSLEDSLLNHRQSLKLILEESGKEAKNKGDELTKLAISNIGIINNNIKKGLENIEDGVDLQLQKIDAALNKHNKDINSFVKSLSEKAENVNQKFANYGEIVSQEVDKLIIRTANLEDSISMQVANLDSVSDKAIVSMQNIDSALSDNINNLNNKVSTAQNCMTSYIDTLSERAKDFETISSDASDKITDLSEYLQQKHQALQANLALGINQLNEVKKDLNQSAEEVLVLTDKSIEKINQTSQTMQKHASQLSEASSLVVTQNQISEASLAQQQKYITDTAARVKDIKSELKRQIEELTTASSTLEKGAVNTVDILKTNINKMLSQCNETINKSKAINDNLLEQANQFDTSANRTIAKVTQFENILVKQNQNMELLGETLGNKSEEISHILDKHTADIERTTKNTEEILNKTIKDFAVQSESINEISANANRLITNTINNIDDKVSSLNILIQQQGIDFDEYSNKVANNLSQTVAGVKQQLVEIEQNSEKMFARMAILEEDTARKSKMVLENSQRSIQQLSDIEKSLMEKHELTEKITDSTISKLGNVNSKALDMLDTTIKTMKSNIDSISDNLSTKLQEIKQFQNELDKNGENTCNKLSEQSKFMENMNSRIQLQSSHINNMLENQKNIISEVVNTLATQTRLGEASLAQQYKYLTDATVDTATKMQEINAMFKDNSSNIFDTTTKLSYEFEVLSDRLLKNCDAINKASKDSISNIDKTSLRLTQCTEDLDSTIYHSVENFNSVFKEYEKYLAGFNTVTAETSTGVIEINKLISVQSDKMVKISDDTKKLVDCFNNVLNDTSNKLADRANDAYEKVKNLGLDLKKLSMEMDDAAKISATHLEKSGDKLRASINEIAANAERISNNILSAGEVFVKQSQALTVIADGTTDKVTETINKLVDAGKDFENKSSNIIKESILFNDTVNGQTKILEETSTKAENIIKNLSETYKEIKIDTFIKDAVKIIGKLEETSVDINRLLNPKDEEDLWKKFYNGDTQVFIRSITKNLSNSQISAIRKEFEKNEELRKQINSYMKEFEALVEKSKNHEHSGTLMAIISGADLGRLYYVLAKAMNKIN